MAAMTRKPKKAPESRSVATVKYSMTKITANTKEIMVNVNKVFFIKRLNIYYYSIGK
jgi:hypothetical protein